LFWLKKKKNIVSFKFDNCLSQFMEALVCDVRKKKAYTSRYYEN